MRKGRSYGELKQASKVRRRKLAENIPDTKAAEWFKAPAYQSGRMILVHGRQMRNRTLGELLDYLWDGFSTGRMRGDDPVPEEVVEYIHGGHLDVAEYLADKFNIKEGVDANE